MGANFSVTVLFFAAARSATGTSRASFDARAGTTVAELARELVARYGEGLEDLMASCALWVNGEAAAPDQALAAGDEVAVLPPVSGGCAAPDGPLDAVSGTLTAPALPACDSLPVMPELNLVEVFDPAYLAGLQDLPLAQLRSKRDLCAELETNLSYLRRLTQARIDLITAESERRDLGLAPPAPDDLVEQLPQILGEHARPPGPGRLPPFFAPAQGAQASLGARIEEICPDEQLGSLSDLPPARLKELLSGLVSLEREVSDERRALHGVQDKLQEEIVRRYKSGEASVDTLLA